MHIRSVTQCRPMSAQYGTEGLFMSLLDKIQVISATIVSVRDAVDAFGKAAE